MYPFINFFYYHWHDMCEIALFSCMFYAIALWLKKDRAHNLLYHFYGLVLLYAGSYILNLGTLFYLLSYIWPILGTLFIIVHQVTLQRNFVALKNNVHAPDTVLSSWLDNLIAGSLQLLNRNIPIFCVIEDSDSVKEFVQTPLIINAPLSKELFDFVYTHNSTDNNLMIWVSNQGYIKALNCTWKTHVLNTSDTKTTHRDMIISWISTSQAHTLHTDIIVFYGDPISYTFTVIIKDNVLPNITGHQLRTVLLTKQTSSSISPSIMRSPVKSPIKSSQSNTEIQEQTYQEQTYGNQYKKNVGSQRDT